MGEQEWLSVERAAEDDRRSTSQWIRLALLDALADRGYLSPLQPRQAPVRPAETVPQIHTNNPVTSTSRPRQRPAPATTPNRVATTDDIPDFLKRENQQPARPDPVQAPIVAAPPPAQPRIVMHPLPLYTGQNRMVMTYKEPYGSIYNDGTCDTPPYDGAEAEGIRDYVIDERAKQGDTYPPVDLASLIPYEIYADY